MNMKVDNWELKSSYDDTQFYYESKLNDDMIACVVNYLQFKDCRLCELFRK